MQAAPETAKGSPWYDPKIRGYVYQALLISVVVYVGYALVAGGWTWIERVVLPLLGRA
jgi:ABC-type amino acid transport system permease subunit